MNTIAYIDNNPFTHIAQIVFSMFVHIADADKAITAQEVRRFQNLLKDNSWIEDDDLRAGAGELRDNYRMYWANYEDGRMPTGPETIADLVSKVLPQLSEERARNFRSDLIKMLERFESNIYGVRFMRNEPAAKTLARQNILSSLEEIREPPRVDLMENKVERKPYPAIDEPVIEVPQPTPNSTNQAQSSAPLTWKAGKTKVICVDVIAETHDTKTYNFVAEQTVLFDYKPGQFVTIEIPLPGQILRRSYTISSSPSRPHVLSITVKKVPLGWMSNWLYDNMIEGFECTVNGPTGKFTCVDHPSDKMLFLAAGSGITPCMSMLRWLADTSTKTNVAFINNVRTPNDIIFHQELLYLNTRFSSRMRLAIVPSALHPGQPWQGPLGMFNEELLRSYAPDFMEREIFVCGPPGYMQAAKNVFASLNFPMEHFHQESFGGAALAVPHVSIVKTTPTAAQPVRAKAIMRTAVSPAPPSIADLKLSAPASVNVNPISSVPPKSSLNPTVKSNNTSSRVTIKGGESFTVEAGQSILDAAESCGITLEHSCRSGVCGACKVKKVSGAVEMEDGHVLSPDEVADGLILTCIGKVKGDVIISR